MVDESRPVSLLRRVDRHVLCKGEQVEVVRVAVLLDAFGAHRLVQNLAGRSGSGEE